jgi:PAS domain S-box-containing protein
MFSRFIIVFVLLALCLGLAGYLYYDNQHERIKKDIQYELSAITELKVIQINAWRRERLADANGISQTGFAADRAQQFMNTPGTPGLRKDILAWMRSFQDASNYQSILLIDGAGRVLLATEEKESALELEEKDAVRQALRNRQAIISDIQRSAVVDYAHIDLVAPLIIRSGKTQAPVGALLLRIDPEHFLYPLVQTWPTPSKSAETLLLRREGNEAVVLNELRHKKDTALTFRVPLGAKPALADLLDRGEKGIIEVTDYRGVPVLAAVQPMAGAPWFLVSKIDQEEIYAPLRERSIFLLIVFVLLISAAGLSIVFWWRQKSAEYLRKQYESELLHRTLSQKYFNLSQYANDIVMLIDSEGNITEANNRAVTAYGYTHDELLRMNIRDLRPPETHHEIAAQMQRVREQNGSLFETVHRRKDGASFPVEVSARYIDVDGKNYYQSIIRDITERKQAEASLIQEKNKSNAIIAAMGDGISIQDREFRVLYQNQVHKGLIGDQAGKFCYEVYSHKDAVCEDCPVAESFKDGRVHTVERSVRSDDGIHHLEVTSSPLRDETGIIIAGIEAVRDITARKQAAVRLTKLNECLLSFGSDPNENINRLVALCGEQLGATCALYNRLEGDYLHALGQWNTPADFNPIDKPEGHICNDIIKAGKNDVCVIRDLPVTSYAKTDPNVVRYGLQTYIGKAVSFGGSFVGSLCVVYQFDRVPAGDELEYLAVVASAIGVEENRNGTMKALSESEHRYKRLVETVTDYLYSVDVENGRPAATHHGPGCVSVTGYTSEEYQADPDLWLRMVHENDRGLVLERAERMLAGDVVPPFEHRIIHKNGSLRWVRNTPVARYSGAGRLSAYDGLITDITQIRLLENQLRQAQKMEAVGQLAGGVAHDFNNILTAIIGYANLLLMKMPGADAGRTYVEHILSSSERAAHLTHSLLAFSRKQIIDLRQVKVNDVIRRVERLLVRVIGEDIEFKTRLCDLDPAVLADSIQIEQVLMNLATNARDAMPNGGTMLVETDLYEVGEEFVRAHSYGRPGRYVVISVADSGTGMDEKVRNRIFEPFYTTKEVGKGTGLGLAMVYGIIKQHNGYIDVYSEPGRGTIFKIYLPVIALAATVQDEEKGGDIRRGTETVLLAEDDGTVRALSRRMLEDFGYRVIEAVDGEDAVRKFTENRDSVDLLVLDIIMPRKNGKEAYREINNIRPGIKALFTSGYTADIVNKKGIVETGQAFLAKPSTPAVFLNKVREVLDKPNAK